MRVTCASLASVVFRAGVFMTALGRDRLPPEMQGAGTSACRRVATLGAAQSRTAVAGHHDHA
jgi:hypothetical protein